MHVFAVRNGVPHCHNRAAENSQERIGDGIAPPRRRIMVHRAPWQANQLRSIVSSLCNATRLTPDRNTRSAPHTEYQTILTVDPQAEITTQAQHTSLFLLHPSKSSRASKPPDQPPTRHKPSLTYDHLLHKQHAALRAFAIFHASPRLTHKNIPPPKHFAKKTKPAVNLHLLYAKPHATTSPSPTLLLSAAPCPRFPTRLAPPLPIGVLYP